jgi:hypothetical protein
LENLAKNVLGITNYTLRKDVEAAVGFEINVAKVSTESNTGLDFRKHGGQFLTIFSPLASESTLCVRH